MPQFSLLCLFNGKLIGIFQYYNEIFLSLSCAFVHFPSAQSENCGFCLNEIKIFHFTSHRITSRSLLMGRNWIFFPPLCVNSPISIFMNISRNSSGEIDKTFFLAPLHYMLTGLGVCNCQISDDIWNRWTFWEDSNFISMKIIHFSWHANFV